MCLGFREIVDTHTETEFFMFPYYYYYLFSYPSDISLLLAFLNVLIFGNQVHTNTSP